MHHLPALQVIIPLIAAPLCSLLGRGRLAWLLATFVTVAVFICSVNLITQVYTNGAISYAMGGWQPPFGIEYKVDLLNAIFLVLVAGIGVLTVIYALPSVEKEIAPEKQPLFYTTYLLCLAGLLGITITNDAFNLYVFLEISSLATYALVAMGKDRRALVAAFEYLIIGTIGATFILIAIGLLYMMTGTLNITDMAKFLPSIIDTFPAKAAVAFFVVGIALKIAIFPLHLWLANSYTNAPSVVSVFLCATGTKIGFYVLIRIIFGLLGKELYFSDAMLGKVFIVLAVFAILIGGIVAIMQDNLKRMLAYSSVAQMGYITLGIGLGMQGVYASLTQVVFHAIAKVGLFMAAGCFAYRLKGIRLEHLSGVGKRMPVTMAAFIICGLSIVGVPGTAGFISKWYLLQASFASGAWVLVAVIIIGSLLSLAYIWRIIEVAFFGRAENARKAQDAPLMMLVPMLFFAALSLALGLYPAYVLDYVGKVVGGM